jgi:hypothetical protein
MHPHNKSSSFFSVKTRENTMAHFHRSAIGAVEEIPASLRSEAYLKVYINGYQFSIDMSLKDFFQLLDSESGN